MTTKPHIDYDKLYKKYYSNDDKINIDKYIKQLNNTELKILNIAIDHLETHFDILKSNGYIKWHNDNNKK